MAMEITGVSDAALSAARGSTAGAGASHVGVHQPEAEASEAERSWSEMTEPRRGAQEPVSMNTQLDARHLSEADPHTQEAQAAWGRPDEVVQAHEPHANAVAPQRASNGVGANGNMGPPAGLSQEPEINAKLLEHGTPALRQKLDNVNDVVRQQYALLEPEVQAGLKQGASKEKKITAANAGSTINHINDAVDNLRSSVTKAESPEDINKAISEYGKQSSMIGGSLGKTVMGASTLGVRQRSLQVAIAGGIGVGIAGIVPSVVSAVNSSRTANNTNHGNGNT